MKQETEKTINAIIDNLAEKLDAPAAVISEAANYGFEKYVDSIWAHAVIGTVIGAFAFVLSILSATLLISGIRADEEGRVIGGTLTFIVFFALSIGFLYGSAPNLIEPEGAAIKELFGTVGCLK